MNFFLLINTKEDILKNELTDPVDFRYGSQWGPSLFWPLTFFEISSFVFSWRKKFIQVWNTWGWV